MIKKLLIANRGEIAVRVAKTAREMGIETVGLYSTPDRDSLHVRSCDVAVHLPGESPASTYLNADLIIENTLRIGADAIHPGYGFLSENADFADKVKSAGLSFIGPSPYAIRTMGSKLESKELVKSINIPTLSSIDVTGLSGNELSNRVKDFTFPILIKASMGGGGRGMRIVENIDDMEQAVESASREAKSAFGDGTVFIEPYLTRPRHIEIQIFADTHGNVISLFERECSIQRRHQKIVEESPSPRVDEALRYEMGEAAVKIAKSVEYLGAGTVEFLLDNSNKFYFLEMNTRLQVEHPVTEFVTGLDLVRLQLEVAAGMSISHINVSKPLGHAIEARLYAEDPLNDYLPTGGEIELFEVPGNLVRIDTGYESKDTVPLSYDPMIAKIISYATSRDEASMKLSLALKKSIIAGFKTNRELLVQILEHDEFMNGDTDTGFLVRNTPNTLIREPSKSALNISLVAATLAEVAQNNLSRKKIPTIPSGFRNLLSQPHTKRYEYNGFDYEISYYLNTSSQLDSVGVNGELLDVMVDGILSPSAVTLVIDGIRLETTTFISDTRIDVSSIYGNFAFMRVPRFVEPGLAQLPGSLVAPMPGTVTKVAVAQGDTVSKGDIILAIEAMKMEHSIYAPYDGIVASIYVSEKSQVSSNEVLAVIEESEKHEV